MCPLTGPSALTVKTMTNTENISIFIQWDEVDDLLTTTYLVTWTSERDHIAHPVTLIEQSSYTITGVTLDTVYTITVTAANKCGQGPEYRTNVSLTIDDTPTMNPTVTAGITHITLISIYYGTTTAIVNFSASTTTTSIINLSTTSTTHANPANTTTADKTCKF